MKALEFIIIQINKIIMKFLKEDGHIFIINAIVFFFLHMFFLLQEKQFKLEYHALYISIMIILTVILICSFFIFKQTYLEQNILKLGSFTIHNIYAILFSCLFYYELLSFGESLIIIDRIYIILFLIIQVFLTKASNWS